MGEATDEPLGESTDEPEVRSRMSYAYRIKLPEATSVVVEEGVWRPTMMELLSPEEMEALAREALKGRGWDEDERGGLSREIEGVRCEVDPERLEVRARLSAEVSARHTVVADSDDSAVARAQRVEAGEREQAKKLRVAEELERRDLTRRLVALEPALRVELDAALHEAHAEALKVKASRMGEVRSISRTESESGALEVTIHVKLR